MRLCKTKTGYHLFTYDSINDLVRFCDAKKYVPQDSWFAGKTLPTWDAVKTAVDIPDAGALSKMTDFVKRLREASLPEIKSHVRRVRFHEDDGDEIDYDRLRSGQEYWRKSEREESDGPTEVTIITDISASAGVGAGDVLWRGAAAIALTSILEEAGYRVELWVIEGTTCNEVIDKILSAGCLKKTHETVDASGIINAISSWFYRAVDFTIVKTQAAHLHVGLYNVGSAYTPTAEDLDSLTPDKLRIYTAGVFNFNAALELVKSELKRITSKKGIW